MIVYIYQNQMWIFTLCKYESIFKAFHGELETILGSKKVGKKLNIGRYRIKYSLRNAFGMEIQLA